MLRAAREAVNEFTGHELTGQFYLLPTRRKSAVIPAKACPRLTAPAFARDRLCRGRHRGSGGGNPETFMISVMSPSCQSEA